MEAEKSEAEKKLWISRLFPQMLNLLLALEAQIPTDNMEESCRLCWERI